MKERKEFSVMDKHKEREKGFIFLIGEIVESVPSEGHNQELPDARKGKK